MTYTRGIGRVHSAERNGYDPQRKRARQNCVSLTTPTPFTILTIVANSDRIKFAIFCFTRASPAGSPNDHFARLSFEVRRRCSSMTSSWDALMLSMPSGGSSIELNRIRSGIGEDDELAESAGRREKPGLALSSKAHVHGLNIVIERFEIDAMSFERPWLIHHVGQNGDAHAGCHHAANGFHVQYGR